jgi:hypothetical protein
MSDDEVEIRDRKGIFLPDDENLVGYCRRLVLAVAFENLDELFGVHTVTVTDADGSEILVVPVADFYAEGRSRVQEKQKKAAAAGIH